MPPPAAPPTSLHARRRLSRGGTKLGHTGRANASNSSGRSRRAARSAAHLGVHIPPRGSERCPTSRCHGGGKRVTFQP